MDGQINEQLKRMVDALPVIKQLFSQDVFLTVMDAEGIVRGYSIPDGQKPMLNVGDVFHDPSGAFDQVISTGRSRHNYLPKEAMGEAFEGELVPVMDGRTVVGCIICTYSVDVKEQMATITAKFQESVNNIQNSLEDLLGGIENLFKLLADMDEISVNVGNDVQNAVEIVSKINGNASRSNILALNASIEAARSGEYGRGFAVVATEMGKLSNDSGKSATEIKDTLNTIMEHMDVIISSIKDAGRFAKEYRGNIGSIQEVLSETIGLAGQLEEDINRR